MLAGLSVASNQADLREDCYLAWRELLINRNVTACL